MNVYIYMKWQLSATVTNWRQKMLKKILLFLRRFAFESIENFISSGAAPKNDLKQINGIFMGFREKTKKKQTHQVLICYIHLNRQ